MKIKMIKNKKSNKSNSSSLKINFRMKMISLILLSLKMIIKISKESEKFVNMTRKYNKMQKRKQIWIEKELKLPSKLKI